VRKCTRIIKYLEYSPYFADSPPKRSEGARLLRPFLRPRLQTRTNWYVRTERTAYWYCTHIAYRYRYQYQYSTLNTVQSVRHPIRRSQKWGMNGEIRGQRSFDAALPSPTTTGTPKTWKKSCLRSFLFSRRVRVLAWTTNENTHHHNNGKRTKRLTKQLLVVGKLIYIGTMRISSSVVAAFLLTQQFAAIHGFSVVGSPRKSCALLSEPVQAEVTSSAPRKKPLSPAELLAQVRKAKGLPEEIEDAPKLFEEPLYDDMRNILLTMEKRVADGPGALSMLEVEEFSAMSIRVLKEMKEKEADRVAGRLDDLSSAAPPPPLEVASTTQDISLDEGPKYDGKGGMGQPKGTRNTYVIEGMDEMSPEEYQKALQKSVSDRQVERKKTGNYGNRETWDYLNNLTGESGQLKDGM
jgi:hypothetical protein